MMNNISLNFCLRRIRAFIKKAEKKIFYFLYLKFSKLLILLTFLLPSININAQIIPTYSINSDIIKNLVHNIDSSTLVLINIDDTIIRPKSKMFLYQNSSYRAFIENLIVASKNKPFLNTPLKAWFIQRKVVLLEPEWPEFIKELKNTGAIVLGLNEMNIKIYDLIKNPENQRINELNQLNIFFKDTINNQQLIKIDNSGNKSAIFYKGIIFTGPFSKAKTILDFMKVTTYMPRKLVIIDNRIDHLRQIEYFLRKFDIDFFGIHYLAMSEIHEKINESVIKFQQNTLLTEGKWLEDEEAEQLLKSTTESSLKK